MSVEKDIAGTLRKETRHHEPIVAIHETGQGFWQEDDVSRTIRAEGENRPSRPSNVIGVQVQWASGGGKTENDTAQSLRSGAEHNYQFARTGMQVRRLTPSECERLQGFPDGWTAIPFRGKPAADGPRYKALGNSMAVNVMAWIGQRIEAVNGIIKDSP